MGRPFGTQSERRHDRPSVVRRRARTGQSPDPRAADTCPVCPRAGPWPRQAGRGGAARGLSVPGEVPVSTGAVETGDSPGAWVAAALRRDRTVASLVPPVLPPVFEAYAR